MGGEGRAPLLQKGRGDVYQSRCRYIVCSRIGLLCSFAAITVRPVEISSETVGSCCKSLRLVACSYPVVIFGYTLRTDKRLFVRGRQLTSLVPSTSTVC